MKLREQARLLNEAMSTPGIHSFGLGYVSASSNTFGKSEEANVDPIKNCTTHNCGDQLIGDEMLGQIIETNPALTTRVERYLADGTIDPALELAVRQAERTQSNSKNRLFGQKIEYPSQLGVLLVDLGEATHSVLADLGYALSNGVFAEVTRLRFGF